MLGDGEAYQALIGVAVVAGMAAIGLSAFGMYTILTGGTTSGPADTDVLGEAACEEFGGDPEPAHDPSYEIERTLLGGSELAEFEIVGTGDEARIAVTTEGRLLDGSARQPDGTNVTVRTVEDENRLLADHGNVTAVRLWIDSIGEESAITRTQLDICP